MVRSFERRVFLISCWLKEDQPPQAPPVLHERAERIIPNTSNQKLLKNLWSSMATIALIMVGEISA
jgi:hypothetical protein